jgi:DNA recombination protein RmuC
VTEQLKHLQDILKNPKQRGVLGEYYLETVLGNVLPPGSYQIQYPFKDGTIVDAVIFSQEKVIPIDSKFSLENYNRLIHATDDGDRKRYEEAFRQDLKNRIDETSKYVKPAEDTMEFAFMFIPSEALYYDLLINKVGSIGARDLVAYASEKKVLIVSPTTFLAYLQTVLLGMRQANIQKSTEQILKNIGELTRHLGNYDKYFQKLGDHLGTSVNMYNNAYKEFKKIDKDVLKITGEAMNIEPVLLVGPDDGEV